MPTRKRLIAGTTEAAEGVVRFGTGRGSYGKCDADAHQQSRDRTAAQAHTEAAALALASVTAGRIATVKAPKRAFAR